MRLLATPLQRFIALIALVALAAALTPKLFNGDDYELTLLMPSADQTFVGAQVHMHGETVGKVTDLGTRDGRALVTVTVDDEHAPVPAGTIARVKWLSVLGARVIELTPGDKNNVALQSGHLLTENVEGVEIDDLLAMLDKPTRKNLQGLVSQLDQATKGQENNLNRTLTEAGPTIEALGAVLKAVGQDGPAIKKLVGHLQGVTETVAARDGKVSTSIANLNKLTRAVARRQSSLSKTLERLPGTLTNATETLDSVKSPVESTRVLLRDLAPSTAKLPAIAADLKPALADAKPVLDALPPTLHDADRLLARTPALVSGSRDLLPTLDSALVKANPMVAFLRPYTPELAGWLSNWVGIFGSQNRSGNYARALITVSASSVDNALPGVPPGMGQDPRPAPGSLDDQAWTDANGDPIQ